MNKLQFDLFGKEKMPNPLQGKRICMTGEFQMPIKELSKRLKALGVVVIDRVSDTRIYKETDAIPPVKETTNFFVVGKNPNEDSLKRYALNEHDGFHAKYITEDKLYDYINGVYTEEDLIPDFVEKKLNIDMSYYNWTTPIINGKTFVSRFSSPLVYVKNSSFNPISQKEIYVPDIPNVNMSIFRQIIGNLGGYANADYFDDTNIVLLSDETLKKLEQGEKDEVIITIENKYNKSNAKIFNVQFTSESDFINWVQFRVSSLQDDSTKALLLKYMESKK